MSNDRRTSIAGALALLVVLFIVITAAAGGGGGKGAPKNLDALVTRALNDGVVYHDCQTAPVAFADGSYGIDCRELSGAATLNTDGTVTP